MKKAYIYTALAIITLITAGSIWYLGSKPSLKNEKGSDNKQLVITNRPITQAILTSADTEDATLGSLDTDHVLISIPKNSFSSSTQISLITPEKIPAFNAEEAEIIGSPIEISADGPVRLNESATITLKIPADNVPTRTEAFRLRVAYWNGEKWDYFKPDAVDLEKGTLTFNTSHFSTYSPSSAKDGKVTNDWIKAKVLQDALNNNLAKPADAYSAQALDMSMEKLGIKDPEAKNKVLSSLLKDPEYKNMQEYYQSNSQIFDNKLKLLVGKKIAEEVPISIIKKALGGLNVIEDTAAASKALGFIVEGNYKDAAKEIGENIADKFVLTIAGKIAIAITNHEIETWKNSEVEAAFKAYRDGSSGYFYGYNNDAKDFDTVWDQMRGIRRQIELEAVKRENEIREDSDLKPLTEEQEIALRNRLKEQYRSQFETRLEREKELSEHEQKLIKIMEGLKAGGILDSTTGPVGLDKGFDLETKLNVLGHFIDKMMKDTHRFDLTDKIGLISEKAISVDDLVQGARIYFSGPNGKKDYAKFLKERFNIDLYPTLKELEGVWPNGQMTITDVILSDELKKAQEEAKNGKKSEDGCDFNMDFGALKGKQSPMSFTIKPIDENSGTMLLQGNNEKTIDIPIKYADGTITGSYTEEEAVISFNWNASKQENGTSIDGSMNINYKNLLEIKASVTANK